MAKKPEEITLEDLDTMTNAELAKFVSADIKMSPEEEKAEAEAMKYLPDLNESDGLEVTAQFVKTNKVKK